jgi:DNA-binding LacI/PurR family transcriptional regulator
MSPVNTMTPVAPQPGRPLYLVVRDAVREAIDAGMFQPGEQMPSTKELSQQMEVSLVTAHRALQELVSSGVLHRSQGKGTFVHERYLERKRSMSQCRLGLIFHGEASLADYYHSQVLEGVRQAAHSLAVDLILLRFGEDVRNECDGFVLVNPLPEEVELLAAMTRKRHPVLVVGARSPNKSVRSIDVDNVNLARQAVTHLVSFGHANIGYVGGADQISNSRDRWSGFLAAAQQQNLAPKEKHILKGLSWRLDERERVALIRMLGDPGRPSAVFAAGYYFALDVYGAAATVGLRVPQDLSIVGVDDPPSAAHLSPPMTTLRQPLVQLGHDAVTALHEKIRNDTADWTTRTLAAELVVRQSSGPVAAA